MQDIEQLALVFVDALDLHVEQRIGIEVDAAVGLDQGGQALLVGLLDCVPALARNAGIVGIAARACAICCRSVTQPSPMVSVISSLNAGIARRPASGAG